MLRHLRFHLRGHLRFQGKPLLPLWLLALFLASCQWVTPMNTQNPRSGLQKASGPGNFSLLSADTPQTGQMITLPSQVHKSPLQGLEEPPKGKHFRLHLSTKASGQGKSTSIHMPEQGAFELVIQSGPQFKVLDANASDGQAVVQMPASNYQALLKVHGKHTRTQKRSLQLEDTLYYLSHELQRSTQGKGSFQILSQGKAKKLELKPLCSSDPDHYRLWRVHNPNSEELEYSWQVEGSQQSGTEVAPPGDSVLETEAENGVNKLLLDIDQKRQDSGINKGLYCDPEEAERSLWWQVGSRTLPVPSAWKSSDGEKYVLRLNNQGVTDLTFRWYKTPNQAVALPPGTAEIGPAGGTVELPGVARLEIPPGALSQTEVVRIIEEKQAPSYLAAPPEDSLNFGTLPSHGYSYFSAFVRIEPFERDLQKPATILFPIDPFYANHYGGFRSIFSLLTTRELFRGNYNSQEYTEHFLSVLGGIDLAKPLEINGFGYISLMNDNKFKLGEPNDAGFRVQSSIDPAPCKESEATLNAYVLNEYAVSSDYFNIAIDKSISSTLDFETKCQLAKAFSLPHKYLNKSQGLSYLPNYQLKEVKVSSQDNSGGVTRGGKFRFETDKKGNAYPFFDLYLCPFSSNPQASCILDKRNLFPTMAHEMFHFFQKGFYTQNQNFAEDRWFLEGSAAWFEATFIHQFYNDLNITDYNPHNQNGVHAGVPLRDSLSYPFLKFTNSDEKQAYFKASFFHVLDDLLLPVEGTNGQRLTSSVNFDIVKGFASPPIQNDPFRSVLATNEGIKKSNDSQNLEKLYHIYARKALIAQDTNLLDTQFYPVTLEKPSGINGVITELHTAENPLSISVELDTMTSKYIHLVPLLLSGSQTVKFRFKQDNPVAPEKINEYDTLPYIGVSVAGVNNPQGEAAIIDANHTITRNLLGDFQSLPVPSSTGAQTEDPGIVLNDAQSAVLVVSNGQWVVQPENPVTVTIEAYIESKRFRSVDPDLIKAQKATQVLVQGTELESINQVIIQSTAHPYTVYTAQAAYNTDSNDLSVSVPGLTAGNYKMAGLLQSGAQCYIPTLQPPLDAPPPSGAPPSGSPPSGAPPSEPPTQDLCVLTNALSLGVTNSPPVSNLLKAQREFIISMRQLNNSVLMAYHGSAGSGRKPFYIRYASGDIGSRPQSSVTDAFLSNFSAYIDSSPNSTQIVHYDFTPWQAGNETFNAQNSPRFNLEEIHGDITIQVINWFPPPGFPPAVAEFSVVSDARVIPHPSGFGTFLALSYREDGGSVGAFAGDKSFTFFLPEFFKNEGLSEVYYDLIEEYKIDPSSVY